MNGTEQPKKDRWFRDMLVYGFSKDPIMIVAIIGLLAALLLPLMAQIQRAIHRNDLVV